MTTRIQIQIALTRLEARHRLLAAMMDYASASLAEVDYQVVKLKAYRQKMKFMGAPMKNVVGRKRV